MPKMVNRARMTTATTGTGTLTLGAAADGFQTFAAAGVADGETVRYVIEDGSAWEIGAGVYAAAGTTLTRAPQDSSAGGAAISLSGGAEVFVAATAEDLLAPDAAVFSGSIEEAVHALSGTSPSLDPANGTVQTHTLSGNTTYSDGLSNGESLTLWIDDGSGYTVTWPTLTWLTDDGSAPTLKTAGYTVAVLFKQGGTLYGFRAGDGG